MAEYIPKSALVAEIEKWISGWTERLSTNPSNPSFFEGGIEVGKYILSFINTLEGKEVDLDKEIENILEKEKVFVTENREVKYYNGDSFNHIYELEFIAKHFFELGLNVAQKGE